MHGWGLIGYSICMYPWEGLIAIYSLYSIATTVTGVHWCVNPICAYLSQFWVANNWPIACEWQNSKLVAALKSACQDFTNITLTWVILCALYFKQMYAKLPNTLVSSGYCVTLSTYSYIMVSSYTASQELQKWERGMRVVFTSEDTCSVSDQVMMDAFLRLTPCVWTTCFFVVCVFPVISICALPGGGQSEWSDLDVLQLFMHE